MWRFNWIASVVTLVLVSFPAGSAFGAEVEENLEPEPVVESFGSGVSELNDLLHYLKIGRLDLAKDYGRAVIESEPDPVVILKFAEDNPAGYMLLQKASQNPHDSELAEVSSKVLAIIEQGRFIRRTDPAIIAGEVRRLSSTARGRVAALKRLQNAGEYAIPFMLDALADSSRREEAPNIIWALGQIGRDAIRPLVAGLQTDNSAVKTEIIKALGKIGYPQALPYLKYVVEKDDAAELQGLAAESITEIDPGAAAISAAELFYRLGEKYYYHAESLAPAEDANFANMWFWDKEARRLIRQEVAKEYFYELMGMRCCEWALRADPEFGKAIGLWIAAFFKAESTGLDMPAFFGDAHAPAMVYATTAGAEYLQQALARALKDENAYIALQTVEALAVSAGEKSLMQRVGTEQPLMAAVSFEDKRVRYSASIALARANPQQLFAESRIVVNNLAEALRPTAEDSNEVDENWNKQLADEYALRAATVMLKLAEERNQVIDLSLARDALIDATRDKREQIKVLAAQILAHLKSAEAQQAIATMALNEQNSMDIKLSAFASLGVSAKVNGNLLSDAQIDAIYELVRSEQVDPQLKSAAASAYGALNLPSEKVKDLILDQAKS